MIDSESSPIIGRVIGTEKQPNSAYSFYFWSYAGADAPRIGIGTLVKIKSAEATVYGSVVEAYGYLNIDSPMTAFLSSGGNLNQPMATERPEIRLYEGAVLRRDPEEPIGAVPMGEVFLADEKDVQVALRTESYKDKRGIMAGLYGSEGNYVPVHFDADFLLGPEAGHLNITGTSGLATKTSYLLFLLSCIFRDFKDPDEKGVAAILFNTKGADLMYIDLPPDEEISPTDQAMYEALGMEPRPMEKVRYFAPEKYSTGELNTLRQVEGGAPVEKFNFTLLDMMNHLDLLVGKEDLDPKADGYLRYLADHFVHDEDYPIHTRDERSDSRIRAKTLDNLIDIVRQHRSWCDEHDGKDYNGNHAATISKIYRRLQMLEHRFKGLIANNETASGPFAESFQFQQNTVYVIDISGLNSQEQELAFAAAVLKLQARMEEQNLGVNRLIIAVDELNKYAPSGSGDSAVLRSLKDIAARGRYMGLVLFGAQQFRSRVDKEVVGNSATHAFGHIEIDELSQPGYGYFSASIKEKLATLERGTLLVKHPHFAQPIFLRFPKPFTMKGGDGMRKHRKQAISPLEAFKKEITRFGHLPKRAELVDAFAALASNDQPKVLIDIRKATTEGEVWRLLEKHRAGMTLVSSALTEGVVTEVESLFEP